MAAMVIATVLKEPLQPTNTISFGSKPRIDVNVLRQDKFPFLV